MRGRENGRSAPPDPQARYLVWRKRLEGLASSAGCPLILGLWAGLGPGSEWRKVRPWLAWFNRWLTTQLADRQRRYDLGIFFSFPTNGLSACIFSLKEKESLGYTTNQKPA
ncbi:hypothetical protein SORBI_3003G378050 [Sorghum bicolor]|jgi:hypothetical protein|uniref:Uncharacterized protein n=1 Tax=Sorghum bicolor TaxID=4558 RepID=A0A1W0W0T0_SORBI|nr:hypothetical protein SORBI_3003G378050 [Sorghum bicolor]